MARKRTFFCFAFAQNILTSRWTSGLPIAIGISIGFAFGHAAGARPESVSCKPLDRHLDIKDSMQTKNIFSALTLLTLISLTSCGPKIDMKNIHGTWIKINNIGVDNPDEKEEVSFTTDGKYKVRRFKKNFITDSMAGTFVLNFEKNLIDITNDPPKLKNMKVNKLTAKEMSVEISDDLSAYFTSNYRRQ